MIAREPDEGQHKQVEQGRHEADRANRPRAFRTPDNNATMVMHGR